VERLQNPGTRLEFYFLEVKYHEENSRPTVPFGDDYTANEIAKLLNTISYEIITGISERVKRVYID